MRHRGAGSTTSTEIILDPDLDSEACAALLKIADRCPVHRTLSGEVSITTELAPG